MQYLLFKSGKLKECNLCHLKLVPDIDRQYKVDVAQVGISKQTGTSCGCIPNIKCL